MDAAQYTDLARGTAGQAHQLSSREDVKMLADAILQMSHAIDAIDERLRRLEGRR